MVTLSLVSIALCGSNLRVRLATLMICLSDCEFRHENSALRMPLKNKKINFRLRFALNSVCLGNLVKSTRSKPGIKVCLGNLFKPTRSKPGIKVCLGNLVKSTRSKPGIKVCP